MEIKNLKSVDFNVLYRAFNRAFADYAIKFEKSELVRMLKRRGFEPALSFAAFQDGEIVAFTFNGIGMYDGVLTAYDTGTGTVKEYRGKGLPRDIFSHSIPYLKAAGVGQYLLEVLQDNEKAISVYRKLGFKTTRGFACFRQKKNDIINRPGNCRLSNFNIRPVDIETIARSAAFCDFTPSWQNGIESIRRAGADLICLGAEIDNELVGYCVTDPHTGDLTQIAVAHEHRRKGIASDLLREAVRSVATDSVKVLNVSSTDQTLPSFLCARNIVSSSDQYEMILTL